MAELADALDSGSSGVKPVQVQVLFLAPDTNNPNQNTIVSIEDGSGFLFFCGYPNFHQMKLT
jgi:hypothetical protein